MGIACGVIDKSGSWLSYNGEKLGQGKDRVRGMLEENQALAEELSEKILAHYTGNAPIEVELYDSEDSDMLFDEE